MKKPRALITESSRKLTVDAINLLTDAIKRDFGLTVQMGAELEYSAVPDKTFEGDKNNPLDISPNAKTSGVPPKFFEHSPIISAHYRETRNCEYELVFSHKNDGPLILARAINSTKKQLQAGIYGKKIHVSLSPYGVTPAKEEATYGLHLNVSLCNHQGDNIFNHGDARSTKSFIFAALSTLTELWLLHETQDNSFERWQRTGIICNLKGADDYLEFRLAGADSDPHKAVMAHLLAVYTALDKTRNKHMPAGDFWNIESQIPENHTQAIAAFKGTTLRHTLNALSQDHTLGDRLHDILLEEAKNRKRGTPEPALAR